MSFLPPAGPRGVRRTAGMAPARVVCARHEITTDDVPVSRMCPVCLGLELRAAGWNPRHLLLGHETDPAPPPKTEPSPWKKRPKPAAKPKPAPPPGLW